MPKKASPLTDVFPGEAVVLSNGQIVTVRPWSAHQVIHEIPALLGRLFARLAPLSGFTTGDPGWLMANLPGVLSVATVEAAEIIRHSTGLPEEVFTTPPPPEGSGIYADEFMALLEAVVRQNRSFFGRLANLRALMKEESPGPLSPLLS